MVRKYGPPVAGGGESNLDDKDSHQLINELQFKKHINLLDKQ